MKAEGHDAEPIRPPQLGYGHSLPPAPAPPPCHVYFRIVAGGCALGLLGVCGLMITSGKNLPLGLAFALLFSVPIALLSYRAITGRPLPFLSGRQNLDE